MKTELCREQIEKLSEENAELKARIAELEHKAADDAGSIHAILTMLDINDEAYADLDDMYKTAHNLAYKLRNRVIELERLIDQIFEVGSDLIYPDGVFDDEQTEIENHWHALVEAWKRCKR